MINIIINKNNNNIQIIFLYKQYFSTPNTDNNSWNIDSTVILHTILVISLTLECFIYCN